MYEVEERNYDNINFETLRREVDAKYTEFHDALSAAYYDGASLDHQLAVDMGYTIRPIDFGVLKTENPVLAKEIFDLLHEGQEIKRQIDFHEINMAKPPQDQISEELYNVVANGETMTPYQKNLAQIITINMSLTLLEK